MFRWLYRIGLFLGAAILALFIGAQVVRFADPYRTVTENVIQQIAVEPQRTVRLNAYGTLAGQIRQSLNTEKTAKLAAVLDEAHVTGLVDLFTGWSVQLLADGVDTAVHKIAAFDATLVSLREAETLSDALAHLRFYDLDRGDVALADLYAQSTAVSNDLAEIGTGLDEVATAVATVTTMPELEKFQQTVGKLGNGEDSLVYQSIEAWQGLPTNMRATKQHIDADVAWLDNFEQAYVQAKVTNDQWHFDTLRVLPRFVAGNYQLLLLGVIGSLLLAIVGWVGSLVPARVPQTQPRRPVGPPILRPTPPQPRPSLAFLWPDGRRDRQPLPQSGEITIGNIIIRRARVRYYLERLDNAFPALLNGQSIRGARILNDGDVLQIGEMRTVFQLAA